MEILKIKANRKKYLPLLLEADEQESMIERYIDTGDMYVLFDGDKPAGECIVTAADEKTLEIKSLAVASEYRGRGLGRLLIEFAARKYAEGFDELIVGTGDSPFTVPFYEKCGFKKSHYIKDFFTDNYDRPIYEGGVLLKDMVYLRKKL